MSDPLNDEAVRLNALICLGIARQSKLDAEGQHVYLDELSEIEADIVEDACHALARTERKEYETAFPSLATILAECQRVPRRRAFAASEARRALSPQRQLNAADWKPPTRAEAKAFMAKLTADVQARRKKVTP